jgi:protein gp37
MAKNNPSDILTGDWNPVVGCQRYSAGCLSCWWIDGIMPWQQRLGNLPASLRENESLTMENVTVVKPDGKKRKGGPQMVNRLTLDSLKGKSGIVGVVQHGDLFWDKTSDEVIHRVLDIVDQASQTRARVLDGTKYVLWSKRAERMARIMNERYPGGVPRAIACGVSIENQRLADERLPHLTSIKGWKFVMIEPMLGPVNLAPWIDKVDWVVAGSETGHEARELDLDWLREVRDISTKHRVPFFLKQVGTSHKNSNRQLDGRSWDEFPEGFRK